MILNRTSLTKQQSVRIIFRYIVLTICSLFITVNALSQGNYDNIIALVNQKDYINAEYLLKNYIKEYQRNPSAYLNLGLTFYLKIDNSEGRENKVSNMDSALYFFNKAISVMSVSYVKKHEEYFQKYQRRDLRTGKPIIRYEDILLDLNDKKNEITSQLYNYCRTSEIDLVVPANNSDRSERIVKPNGKYYGLIIGISKYNNNDLNLLRPVKDAKKFADLIISNYSFNKENVSVLLNPERQDIISEFYRLRKKLTSDDNLLIFYAGHGMYDEDAGQGYWWPSDADSNNPANWLSNSDIRDQIRGIKSAHTLLIADACFSGGIFRTRGVTKIKKASVEIISLYKMPSRRAITSGTMTTVPDHSVFFEYLIKALDVNDNIYLSSQVLFDSFRLAVINNTFQVPQDGIIAKTGDEGGDFIFIKK